jgi:hypothetical protein
MIGGSTVKVSDISGVLTLRPCVFAEELAHIFAGDRAYVAAEMNAFLIAFLSKLKCPILNRPTPLCLSGPNWRLEQWVKAAASLSIPVVPVHRRITDLHAASAALGPGAHEVTVVGGRCFGPADAGLASQARQLAKIANVDLVSFWFRPTARGAQFVAADLWPDLARAEIAEAVLDFLSQSS